jgi:hypothetical protein
MLNRILPPSIDNTYRGHKLALWLFGVVVFVKTIQSVMVIFNGYSVLRSADGVPLETFSPAGAQTVVSIWALYGLSRLFILLLCVLTLLRYRSAIPFMFTLLIFNYLAGELILRFVPLVRVGTPAGPVMNLVLFVLMIAGLGLSLWNRAKPNLFTKL